MKIYINITDEWMIKYVEEAQDFLADWVDVDCNIINFDATNKIFYEQITYWDKMVLRKRSSIKSSIIKALGYVFSKKKYDVYALIVDKKDTYKAGVPLKDRGDYDPNLNVFEVYASKSRRKINGHRETTAHIIHEILHALSDYKGKKDMLHFFLDRGASFEDYLKYL